MTSMASMLIHKTFFRLIILFINISSASAGCVITEDPRYLAIFVNCSRSELNHIPDLPFNTTSVDLSFNSLSVIHNGSFSNVTRIKYLDLSHNVLTHLEPEAFQNCHLLQHLDLSHNKLALTSESFPDVVFDPLFDLRWLNMKLNQKGDGTYPERIFHNLGNLSVLSIGAYKGQVFGAGFGYLQNLKELFIGEGDCKLYKIMNNTFAELGKTTLEKLEISHCPTEIIEIGSLAPLKHLTDLTLYFLHLGTKQALTSLAPLRGRTMTRIQLRHIRFPQQLKYPGRTIMQDRTILAERFHHLSKICVRRFQFQENDIIWIELISLTKSPFARCIHDVDFSSNQLTGDTLNVLLALRTFSNLRTVDFSNPAMNVIAPNVKPKYLYEEDFRASRVVNHSNPCIHSMCNISIPNFSSVASVSGITRHFKEFYGMYHIVKGENVVHVNLSYIGMNIVDATVTGLENLKVMDISGNTELDFKNLDIFSNFPFLEELQISYYSFQQKALMDKGNDLLKKLPNLKRLFLAYNQLYLLPRNLFHFNSKLEVVDFSGNLFNSMPFDLGVLPRLINLDMSFNTITSLTKCDRDMIESHSSHKPSFQLKLRYNLLACGCDSIEFLLWLKETHVHLDNERNYACLEGSEGIIKTEILLNDFLKTWRRCIGWRSFYITMVLFAMTVASILGSLLVKTNKTSIIYVFLNSLKKQLWKPKRKDFAWDVYIAYAEKDYQWICLSLCPELEKTGLRLYVYDRDSVPGDSIPDQIAENISKSWKIILYFSKNYETDQWSYMSMMAAINSVDNFSPEKIILLLPEEEHPRLPMCLLEVVPESCIFHVPTDCGKQREMIRSITDFVKK